MCILLDSDVLSSNNFLSFHVKKKNRKYIVSLREIMYSKSKHCIEHPLGILCKCAEYQSMIEKLIPYNISTWNQLSPKVNIEPIASAEVSWINNHMKVDEDITKPIIMYPRKKSSINARNVDRIWIPVSEDAVSLKSMRISWKLWK